MTIIAAKINRRIIICVECYQELDYGRWSISSTVQINDAICRINYGLHNVLLRRKGAILCCQTFGQNAAYSLMTLIIMARKRAQSNTELCLCDVMRAASCEMTLQNLLHRQFQSIIYKVLCACNFVQDLYARRMDVAIRFVRILLPLALGQC